MTGSKNEEWLAKILSWGFIFAAIILAETWGVQFWHYVILFVVLSFSYNLRETSHKLKMERLEYEKAQKDKSDIS